MKLIGIDFETNGPEPTLCDITEAAWVLYDTDFGKSPITSDCFLNKDVVEMDPVAQKITGITLERCHKYGIYRDEIISHLDFALQSEPDYLVAHNARAFDKIIFERLMRNHDISKVKWIDTLEDLPEATYERLGTRTLEFMAARSGFLNPFPHAALPDVYTMMKILMNEDLDVVAERAAIPSVIVMADVSFHDKDKAKELQFSWQQIRGGKVYPKKWVKKIKKDCLEDLREKASFKVVVID